MLEKVKLNQFFCESMPSMFANNVDCKTISFVSANQGGMKYLWRRIKHQCRFFLPSWWRAVRREASLSTESAVKESQSFDRWLINNARCTDHYTSPCVQSHHVEQRFLWFTNALTYIPNCTYSHSEQDQNSMESSRELSDYITLLHTAKKWI